MVRHIFYLLILFLNPLRYKLKLYIIFGLVWKVFDACTIEFYAELNTTLLARFHVNLRNFRSYDTFLLRKNMLSATVNVTV